MVALSDIPRITQLNGEFQMNARVIDMMADTGGLFIPSMSISRRTEEGIPQASFTINTSYMPAAENMIAQIRVLLQQRQEIIRQELHGLGVDVTQMAAASPVTAGVREAPPLEPPPRRTRR
jgi:hypothetical protein